MTRARGGDDTGPEAFGQQPGGEPVIAVAVGDEDVRQVPALRGDPVAEHLRMIFRQPGVRQHRVLVPVDQRAGHGREPLRLSVRQITVLWRRVVDEHVVTEVSGQVHDCVCPFSWPAANALVSDSLFSSGSSVSASFHSPGLGRAVAPVHTLVPTRVGTRKTLVSA